MCGSGECGVGAGDTKREERDRSTVEIKRCEEVGSEGGR
jgi:hypothetical protein